MKKALLTLATLPLFATASLALADNNTSLTPHTGWYLGGGIGYGSVEGGGSVDAIKPRSRAGIRVDDDSAMIAGIHSGYDFNDMFAAQIQYMYLPTITLARNGIATNIHGNMFALEGRANYYLMDNQINAFATAGYAMIDNSIDGPDVDAGQEYEPIIGFGAGYNVNKNVNLNAKYKAVLDANNKYATVHTILFGMQYNY